MGDLSKDWVHITTIMGTNPSCYAHSGGVDPVAKNLKCQASIYPPTVKQSTPPLAGVMAQAKPTGEQELEAEREEDTVEYDLNERTRHE